MKLTLRNISGDMQPRGEYTCQPNDDQSKATKVILLSMTNMTFIKENGGLLINDTGMIVSANIVYARMLREIDRE